jgi:hypothetical protein
MFSLAPVGQAAALEKATGTIALPYVEPATGWYWNPAESGRGFAIERQGDMLFLAGFMYEVSGAQVWYVSSPRKNSEGSYDGALIRYDGGQSIGGAYRAPTGAQVGTINLAFGADLTARMKVNVPGSAQTTIWLERFAFGSAGFAPSEALFHNGWYWSSKENGRGFFVEVQGKTAYLATFMYDEAGKPAWYTAAGTLIGTTGLYMPLGYYLNGQSLQGEYRVPVVGPGSIGSTSLFLTEENGTIRLPNGNMVKLETFDFNGGRSPTKPAPGTCPDGERLVTGVCAPQPRPGGGQEPTPTPNPTPNPTPEPGNPGPGPGPGGNSGPATVVLRTKVIPQEGQTFQIEYCRSICQPVHSEYFVSDEDYADEETPAIYAYVNHTLDELNKLLRSYVDAGKLPPDNVVVAVLGNAITTAIENDTQSVMQDVIAGFTGAGYPIPGAGTPGPGGGSTPPPSADTATESRCINATKNSAGNFRLNNVCEFKVTVSWCVVAPDNRSWVQCGTAPDRYGSFSEGQTDLGAGKTYGLLDTRNATQVHYVACATSRGKLPMLTDLSGNGYCK